jgi:TRAP-type C4-dicarboxylate transport system permease small subunit
VQLITKLDRVFAKAEEILLALLLVGMVILAALQVLLRNIWNTSIDWADTTLQNATLLLGLLGAAVATSEGRHLTIDIVSRLLGSRTKLLLKVVIGAFCVLLCAILAKGGWTTYRVNFEQWLVNIPAGWGIGQSLKQELLEGNIPQWLSQVMLPLGYALIGFHFLLRLVRDTGSLITAEPWERDDHAGLEGEAALDEMEARASKQEAKP